MTNYPVDNELSVDRREEVVTKQQPGYVGTEQVAVDAASERRQGANQFNGLLMTVLGVLEILLGFRFVLQLIAANPDSGFAQFIYGVTDIFVAPFAGLVANPTAGGMALEITTLIAMAVYALIFWVIMRVVAIGSERPSARTVTRSVSEGTPRPAAGVRTEHTTTTTQR